VEEIKNVFSSYGISVDIRHLNLIADFMTHGGGFRPCNRIGMESNTSAFLKMSFETATKFLVESTLKKQWDHLESPSSRIILGQIVDVGTGSFGLLHNIQV
jgi:DNA-directed RNA polymerase I subunit RPA1